jgi:signal transduction histidine kinase
MQVLEEFDLDILGICGGSVDEKAKFLNELRPYWEPRAKRLRPPYIYVENWDAPIEIAQALNLDVAIHLHYPMAMGNIDDLLKDHPLLRWLPDTAHLHIGGVAVEEQVLGHADRLAAVHLKDWTDDFGRTSYRYAKGFIELGRGILKKELASILDKLLQAKYAGWIVAELDYPRAAESESVRICAEWLRPYGPKPANNAPRCPDYRPTESPLDFYTEVTRIASYGDPFFYNDAAQLLNRHLKCSMFSVWAYHNGGRTFTVLANSPPTPSFSEEEFHLAVALSGICLQRGETTKFDLSDPGVFENHPGISSREAAAVARKFVADRNVRFFHCVPVYNVYNPNQVRFVLHLLYNQDPPPISDEVSITATARRFSRAAEIALTERCVIAARETNQVVSESRGTQSLERGLLELIQKHLGCEGATLFHIEASGHLVAGETTGLAWNPDLAPFEHFYAKNDGSIMATVLTEKQPLLLRDVQKYRARMKISKAWKSAETVLPNRSETCLHLPYFGRASQLLGVLRCRNKICEGQEVKTFSEDDLVLVETIFQTASPDLEIFTAERNRAHALSRLFHELAQPLASTKSAIVMAADELDRSKTILKEDYLGDARSWIELSERLLSGFDFLNWQARDLETRRTWVLPVKQIIAPAVRQVRALLLEKAFSERHIDYGRSEEDYKQFSPLFVDLNMFQQVIFNLLTNAIKYAGQNARDFKVEIRPDATRDRDIIYFRDWGRGIPEEWRAAIFEEGVRVEGVGRAHVAGRGLGLWVVSRIVKLHNGSITLTHCKEPTEFTISLARVARRRQEESQ